MDKKEKKKLKEILEKVADDINFGEFDARCIVHKGKIVKVIIINREAIALLD
jgi:hypothetical protein